ncbi:MAG: substrate-binding domain-containing protein [Treponema sp.]|nr:substrate-binding domain-containing protein [Treponema sp.]
MKKFLKITAAVFAASLAFSGCNNSKKSPAASPKSTPAKVQNSAAPQRIIQVGYAQVGHESAWRLANTESFKKTFTAENGYNLTFVDADNNQEVQIAAIRDFIAKNVDYIVMAPCVETGWDEVLKEAKEAAIPVILSDRMLQTDDQSLYLCWVGGNFLKESEDAVFWLDTYLNEKGMNGEIKIVDLQGSLGASAQIGRTQGIENGIASHSNWKLVAQKSGNFSYDEGKTAFESIISEIGIDNIDVVFSENDDMAFAVVDVLKENGKKPGEDVIIITFDAGKKAFEAMIAGEINCAAECNPLHGPRVDRIIKTLENGETVDKTQYVDEEIFDQTNAAQVLPTRAY